MATTFNMDILDDDFATSWQDRPTESTHQHGTKRKYQPTEAGMGMFANGTNEVYGGNCENVPRVPAHFRWDGVCEYLPQAWAERARAHVERLRNVRVICQGCAPSDQPPPCNGLIALAWASDHDSAMMDHKLFIVDSVGNIVAENDFHPLFGTQLSGAAHRRDLERRMVTMRPWQRTIF